MADVSKTSHHNRDDNPIPLDRLLNRVLNSTDEAWRAHESGGGVDFTRVENSFKSQIANVSGQRVSIGDHKLSVSQLSKILNALVASERLAERTDAFNAYMNVANAVEPITDRSKLLDTQMRPS